jgi:hypothetical protein
MFVSRTLLFSLRHHRRQTLHMQCHLAPGRSGLPSPNEFSAVVVEVGSVPAGDQASAVRATAAIPGLRDIATITFPRVWSVRCHRVDSLPALSVALLPSAGTFSGSIPEYFPDHCCRMWRYEARRVQQLRWVQRTAE